MKIFCVVFRLSGGPALHIHLKLLLQPSSHLWRHHDCEDGVSEKIQKVITNHF